MMFNKIGKSEGFVRAVIIIIIALFVLGYFGINVADIMNSPTVKSNLNYVWGLVKIVWDNYLKAPAEFIWNKVVIGLGWDSLVKLLNSNYKSVPQQVVPVVR